MNGSYGRAATGLTNDASFAANAGAAKAGAEGEVKTAAILDGFCLKAAILHDLRVPLPGFKANIDHVVVSGKRVLIIDTKVWKPGFYWSFFGANRRGKERIAHTEKDLSYAQQALITHLRGTGAVVSNPHLVIWSSRKTGTPTLWALRVPNARLLHGDALLGFVKGFIGREAAARPTCCATPTRNTGPTESRRRAAATHWTACTEPSRTWNRVSGSATWT
jgi:hypothetical protein